MQKQAKKQSKILVEYKLTKAEINQIASDIKVYGLDARDQLNDLNKAHDQMPLAKLLKEILDKVYENAVSI